jgi:hypothetical protein
MKNLSAILQRRKVIRLMMVACALCAICTLTLLSGATVRPQSTITINNNSNWEIRHIYLSPADNDNWGPDQLNDGSIAPGHSVTLTVSWDQATVKVVSEDADGCFLYNTVDATANSVWTITSDATPNCGG